MQIRVFILLKSFIYFLIHRNDTEKVSEKLCFQKCRHGCTMTRYSIKQLSNNPAIILNSKTHQPMQAPNQTSFFLTWGSFEFLKMEQCYKYETFVQFLSELGGSLGIWLGLSVLSLLQVHNFNLSTINSIFRAQHSWQKKWLKKPRIYVKRTTMPMNLNLRRVTAVFHKIHSEAVKCRKIPLAESWAVRSKN